jgi:hypothetical protein
MSPVNSGDECVVGAPGGHVELGFITNVREDGTTVEVNLFIGYLVTGRVVGSTQEGYHVVESPEFEAMTQQGP